VYQYCNCINTFLFEYDKLNGMKQAAQQPEKRIRRRETRANTCDYGRAYRLLEEKWLLFVLHHLRQEACGFNELRRRLPGISPTLLSERLDWLEEGGLVRREVQSVVPPRTSYELTEAGRALGPVLDALAQWSAQYFPCISDETETK
jgi:DNA-binding HxlR family transcriptional regulator